MAYDEELAERVRSVLAGRRDVEEKRMFGGLCFMVRGHMTVGVDKDQLLVRADRDDCERWLSEKDVRPMDFTGRIARTATALVVAWLGAATARPAGAVDLSGVYASVHEIFATACRPRRRSSSSLRPVSRSSPPPMDRMVSRRRYAIPLT